MAVLSLSQTHAFRTACAPDLGRHRRTGSGNLGGYRTPDSGPRDADDPCAPDLGKHGGVGTRGAHTRTRPARECQGAPQVLGRLLSLPLPGKEYPSSDAGRAAARFPRHPDVAGTMPRMKSCRQEGDDAPDLQHAARERSPVQRAAEPRGATGHVVQYGCGHDDNTRSKQRGKAVSGTIAHVTSRAFRVPSTMYDTLETAEKAFSSGTSTAPPSRASPNGRPRMAHGWRPRDGSAIGRG